MIADMLYYETLDEMNEAEVLDLIKEDVENGILP